jgi:hypothetical protein
MHAWSHLAIAAADQLPVHEALGRQEAAPEAQEAVKVAALTLQHADQQPVASCLRTRKGGTVWAADRMALALQRASR